MSRPIQLLRESFPGRAALDPAVSRALLDEVAAGRAAESFRLYRPDDVVAFSVLDRAQPGFAKACAAARDAGFAASLRLAGGRAAVFHTGGLAFAWTIRTDDARSGIGERFDEMARIVAAALGRLGVDARVGEVPGEYCPGEHSVNARGARKLMGVGQRIIRGAAHVGGVIVVRDRGRVADVLERVYDSLGHPFDPDTAGCVADEAPGVDLADVEEALLAELDAAYELVEAALPPGLLARAEASTGRFTAGCAFENGFPRG